MTRADRIWAALRTREPILTYIAIQLHRDDSIDPDKHGLLLVLRTVNKARRRVKKIAVNN